MNDIIIEDKPTEVEYEGETYLIPTQTYKQHIAKNVFNLNLGFSAPNHNTEHFSKQLIAEGRNYDGIEVRSFQIIGTNIFSKNKKKYPNNSRTACKKLYDLLMQKNDSSNSLNWYGAQSSGAINMNAQKRFLFNPLIQCDYKKWNYFLRAAKGSLSKEIPLTFSSFGLNYIINFIGNHTQNMNCLSDLTKIKNEELYNLKQNEQTIIISGVDENLRDQFSDYADFLVKVLHPVEQIDKDYEKLKKQLIKTYQTEHKTNTPLIETKNLIFIPINNSSHNGIFYKNTAEYFAMNTAKYLFKS